MSYSAFGMVSYLCNCKEEMLPSNVSSLFFLPAQTALIAALVTLFQQRVVVVTVEVEVVEDTKNNLPCLSNPSVDFL